MTPGNFQDLEISMAMILTIPMEFSMAHGNFQVLEIFRGPGNFHGPWKIPWPMENSMGGLMSGWTRGVPHIVDLYQHVNVFLLYTANLVLNYNVYYATLVKHVKL